jgi:O-antigen/teichoic acid export membrane protein
LLRALGDQARSVFSIEKRTGKYVNVNFVAAVVCLGLYATLIPRYRVWGAVWATLGGFAIYCAASFWEAQRLRHFDLEYRRMASLVILSILCVGVATLLSPAGFWIQVGVGLLLFLAWCAVLLGIGFFDEAERRLAAETFASVRHRLGFASR